MKTNTAKNSVITITVDSRERCKRLIRTLQEAGDTVLKRDTLSVGDYKLNNLITERKTMPDLISSVKDGRLFLQAGRLIKTATPSIIILEGTFRDLLQSGMKREAIQGTLITLMLRFGIPILRSNSPEESARLMLYAARQLERDKSVVNRSKKILRSGGKTQIRFASQLHVLQGIPGIGPRLAKQILKRFGSLAALFKASKNDLSEIKGIGMINAEQIYKTIHDEITSFEPDHSSR